MGGFLVNSFIFYIFVFMSKERYKQQICYATKSNQQNTPRCKSVSTSPKALLQISELLQSTTKPVISNQKMNVYLKELADICGIDKRLTTHVARHTFATLTLANKVTMDNVARMMGHANTQITRHYARILDSSILRDMQVVAENM